MKKSSKLVQVIDRSVCTSIKKPYRLIIKVPLLTKMTNQLAGRSYWAKHGDRDKWHNIISTLIEMPPGHKPVQPLESAAIIATRFSSSPPDYDGLAASFKYPIDALKSSGIIVDDNMNVIGMPDFYWKKVGRKKGSIELIVEER